VYRNCARPASEGRFGFTASWTISRSLRQPICLIAYWDTLLTTHTEEAGDCPTERASCTLMLKLKFERQLDRSRATDLVQRIETAALAAAAEIVV